MTLCSLTRSSNRSQDVSVHQWGSGYMNCSIHDVHTFSWPIIIDIIETGSLKDKNTAFTKLRAALNSHATDIHNGQLNKLIPRILEILYRALITEQSTYHKSLSSSKSTASASASRLSSCSSTVRLLVELSLSKLKVKVIRSLIEHILDHIQDAEGEYCEPIALDYTKCLSLILSFGCLLYTSPSPRD